MASKAHATIVSEISSAVKQFYTKRIPFRISHGSTNSTRHGMEKRRNVIDTSRLSNVLSIDTQNRTCLVEPNVPMDRLVAATLPHGLIPPVVMEFPGITAGGGYAGTAGESSSFKHGYFDRTVNYVEMVMGDGEVRKVSQRDDKELFDGAAGAAGTLGVTTLLELQLEEAKPYVQATYQPVRSVPQALNIIKELTTRSDVDYVDGIMFSKTHGAVVSGKMVDKISDSSSLQHFSRPWDPWFYLHVQDVTSGQEAKPVVETIPLAEYLFRYVDIPMTFLC